MSLLLQYYKKGGHGGSECGCLQATGGDRAYRRPDHAAVTQAVADLEAAAEQPRPAAAGSIYSAHGFDQPSLQQQPLPSQPVQPSLTVGQLSAAGEQGYTPAGVSLVQQTVTELPQVQQARPPTSLGDNTQPSTSHLPASEAPVLHNSADVPGVRQLAAPQVDGERAYPIQAAASEHRGLNDGHAIPMQHAVGLAIPHTEPAVKQPPQQETFADAQESKYALDRHSVLMRAAEEHEQAMEAERASLGQTNPDTLPHSGHTGAELPAQASAPGLPADAGFVRTSYASDRHAALMRLAEAHEQAHQAQAASQEPATPAMEPATGYDSDRHAALMRAAFAHEQPADAGDTTPEPAGGHQAVLPNGLDSTQQVHEAATASTYGSERHAALMRAAEEHEQRILQSHQPSAQQELFSVSDGHAALLRAAEEQEQGPSGTQVPAIEQGTTAGYEATRHAALMRAVAEYEQTPEVEQPPEQMKHEPMRFEAATHAQYDHRHGGPFLGHPQAAPVSIGHGQAAGASGTSSMEGGMGHHQLTQGTIPQSDAFAAKQQLHDGFQPAANGPHEQADPQGAPHQHTLGQSTASGVGLDKHPAVGPAPGPQPDINQLYNGATPP